MHRSHGLAPFVALAALALGGCVFERYPYYDRHEGTVTFAWTLAGVSEPDLCDAAGAPFVRIVVWDANDGVVSDDLVACRWLGARYVLTHGWYTAALSLADAHGHEVDAGVAVGPFDVGVGLDTFVGVDLTLPSSSLAPTRVR